MRLNIKLNGGMTCQNKSLSCYGMNRFNLEIPKRMTLGELHNKLTLEGKNLVSIVDGKAQLTDYVLDKDCTVAIFLSMGDRQYDFFGMIK